MRTAVVLNDTALTTIADSSGDFNSASDTAQWHTQLEFIANDVFTPETMLFISRGGGQD